MLIEHLESRTLLTGVTFDPTFGTGGIVAGVGGPIRVGADDKIVADTNGHLQRLNPDGSNDPTFNASTWVDDWKPGVARQADRKLLVLSNGVITRYNTDGTIDRTFGSNGQFSDFVLTPAYGTYSGVAYSKFEPSAIAMQGNDIIVAGDAVPSYPDTSSAANEFAVERILPNGTIDQQFALRTAVGDNQYAAVTYRVRVKPDGEIFLAGSVPNDPLGILVHFNADGGDSREIIFASDRVEDVAFAANGQIVIAGDKFIYGQDGPYDNQIVWSVERLNADYSIDRSFSDYANPLGIGTPEAVQLTPDNKIVVSVDTPTGPEIARLIPPVAPDATASISGFFYNDANGNGRQDGGEAPLRYWQAYADLNNNGVFDPGEPSAFADYNGYYKINNLAPGAYRIREVRQDGWTRTQPAGACPLGYYDVTVAADQVSGQHDFGNTQAQPAPTGQITGYVINDLNGDGKAQSNEAGLSGWLVYVDSNGNGKLDSGEARTLTNSAGRYVLDGLGAGNYVVRAEKRAGWSQTAPLYGYGQHLTLSSGQHAFSINFLEHHV